MQGEDTQSKPDLKKNSKKLIRKGTGQYYGMGPGETTSGGVSFALRQVIILRERQCSGD